MDSGMIGKILKAKQYAEEQDRIEFTKLSVIFHGENNDHLVTYDKGTWTCQCSFFASHDVCSHTMALERILGPMLKAETDAISNAEAATEPA
jgi:hypothetical protein